MNIDRANALEARLDKCLKANNIVTDKKLLGGLKRRLTIEIKELTEEIEWMQKNDSIWYMGEPKQPRLNEYKNDLCTAQLFRRRLNGQVTQNEVDRIKKYLYI